MILFDQYTLLLLINYTHFNSLIKNKLIYELKRKGESYATISNTLNIHRIPAPKGGTWGQKTVYNIIKNDIHKPKTATNEQNNKH